MCSLVDFSRYFNYLSGKIMSRYMCQILNSENARKH